jgi:hypothetical protein
VTRRELAAVAVIAVWLVGASAVANYLGVAGYRGGWALAIALLVVATTALAWLATARVGASRMWVLAFAILGLVSAARQIDTAPLSKNRLAAALDTFKLDFYKVESEERSGHSWCKPTCPSVTRRYRAPLTTPVFAKDTVASTASYYHYLPDLRAVVDDRRATGFDAVSERATLTQRAVRKGDHLEVTVTLTSHRGKRTKLPRPTTVR